MISTRPFNGLYQRSSNSNSNSNSNSFVDLEKINETFDSWRGGERDEEKNIGSHRTQARNILNENELKKNIPRGKKKKGRRVTMKMGQEIRNMMKDLADQSMKDSDDNHDVSTEQEDEEEMLLYVDGIDRDIPDIHDIPVMDIQYDNSGELEWLDILHSEDDHDHDHHGDKVENMNEYEHEYENKNKKERVNSDATGGSNKMEISDGQGLTQGHGSGSGSGSNDKSIDRDRDSESASVADGLYRLVNNDWMEEFKSVWKMQCVLR